MRSQARLCLHRVVTDQLPSVADFLVAVSFVSTQGRHTPGFRTLQGKQPGTECVSDISFLQVAIYLNIE